MTSSVDVSVEALQECVVQEITYDGQEVYVLPLTMSENLTKMAHKIDFAKIENDDSIHASADANEEYETDQESEQQQVTQPSLWPWESIRNKLRNALTEVSVLQDVLHIARDKKYLMLDYVEHDAPDARNGLLLVARKRAMSTAAGIITSGLDRMKKNLDTLQKNRSQDFHYELLKLRKSFKLKKLGTKIFGDLSYKSSGSCYQVSGTFEVLKADNESVESDSNPPCTNIGAPQHSPLTSNLSVIIPEELLGHAYIKIFIRNVTEEEVNQETFFAQSFLSSPTPYNQYESLPWMRKLEMAQQVIFCKEAFDKLCLEAYAIKSKVQNMVCGNQILCMLYRGTNMFITFVHHRLGSPKSSRTSRPSPSTNMLFPKEPQDIIIEHCLYQLLRESHLKVSMLPMPHPISSRLCSFKCEHLIGPGAFSTSQLKSVKQETEDTTMLESLAKVARLQVMRQKVADMLDELSREIQEPLVFVHAMSNRCAARAAFRIIISFSGFDQIRTVFTIYVTHDEIEVALGEGRYIQICQGLSELKDHIFKQVTENHAAVVVTMARQFGWKITSHHKQAIMNKRNETLETGIGITIASPQHVRQINVCCSQAGYQKVSIQRMNKDKTHLKNIGISDRWKAAMEGFELVNMKRVPGVHFATKMENLIALLSYDSFGKL